MMRLCLFIAVFDMCLFMMMVEQNCVNGQAQLIFQDVSYPNNSVLLLNDVGDHYSDGRIFCTTNKSPCCSTPPNRFGEWYYPNGSLVPNNGAGYDFHRGRGDDQTIHLSRRNNAQSPTGSFCCELPDNNDVNHLLCVTLVSLSITPSGNSTAGEDYRLTCTITGATTFPIFTWSLIPSNYEEDTRLVSYEMPSPNIHTSIVQFVPLKSSHEGKYTCRVTIGMSTLVTSNRVNVMIPTPIAVTITDSHDGIILPGSSLDLTCSIELNEAADIPVTVNTVWSGPSDGTQFTTITSVATMMTATTYTSTATISSVETSDSGEYTCTATVSSTSTFYNISRPNSGVYILTVALRAPNIISTTPQSTSITITWIQPEGDEVDSYEIVYSYRGPCPGVTQSESVSITGSLRQYTVGRLHEYSNYTITITAQRVSGEAVRSQPVTIIAATLPIVPSGPPQSLMVTSTTPFSITIQWSEVECLQQNSIITGYSVRYGGMTVSVTGASNRSFTATGLFPRTSYTFEVAAVSANHGTGPYGLLSIETIVSNHVSLLLNGVLYSNNSIVTLDEIGEGSAALYCLTNNTDCCYNANYNINGYIVTITRAGAWFFPNGSSVRKSASGDAIYRSRGPSFVRLQRRNNAQTTGVFHCEIPDASGTNQTLYVGVYPVNSGSSTITGLMYNRSTLTLTCTSTGGPATTVTWRKNGAVVEVDGTTYHQSQRVVDASRATYKNTLSSGALANLVGTFTCTVGNQRGSSSRIIAQYGVFIPEADRNQKVVGEVASIKCISDAPAIRIEWLDSERRVVARVDSMEQLDLIFNPVNDSIHNSVYTCQVTREDGVFKENVTIVVTVPPSTEFVSITTTASGSSIAGQEYTLVCTVSVLPGLTHNIPTATWFNQDGSPVLSDDGITILPSTLSSASSTLTFSALNIIHGGVYTCEGRIESPVLDSPQTVSQTETVTVQIPSPVVTLLFSIDGSTNTRVPPLILTCSIELSMSHVKAVNIPVTVNTVWSGPNGPQFTSVTTRETDTTYTSTATFSTSVAIDVGEYTCRVTVSPTSPTNFVQSSDETIATKSVKDVLQRFQLKLRRTDDCITWNANRAKEIRSYIFEELLQAINSRCQCEVPKENLLNGVFSCLDSHDQTTYRGTIIGMQSYTATQLEGYLQDWVTSDPTLTIQWYAVKLDPMCPVSISSLAEPECAQNQ